MKVISRQAGEKIIIDDHITVTVKAIEQSRIILSIESSRNEPPYYEETISLCGSHSSVPETLLR